jgi:uncharacterized membrane protein
LFMKAPDRDSGGRRWAGLLALLGLMGYAVLSHVLMVHAAQKPWAVIVLFGPLLLAVGGVAWHQRHALIAAAVALGVIGVSVVVWRGGVDDVNRLYVMQHAGIHVALALGFVSTLGASSVPLITSLAGRLHAMTPAMDAYTRRLTQLWALYFVAMAGASVLLYALAPWPAWSLFANLFAPASAVAFFVGEYWLRYRLHPEFERTSLSDAVRAYRARSESLRD